MFGFDKILVIFIILDPSTFNYMLMCFRVNKPLTFLLPDSLKADSEEPDDDSLQKRSREELPDGIMFRDNTTVFDVNITRDNEMLLGHVAIFMKHCTAKECNSDQCYKFGDRIICMSFSICKYQLLINVPSSFYHNCNSQVCLV